MNLKLVIVLATATLFAGCNGEKGNFAIGTPTVYPTFTEVAYDYTVDDPATPKNEEQTKISYKVAFKMGIGSPGGVVQSLVDKDGIRWPVGVTVSACSVMSDDGKTVRSQLCEGGTTGINSFTYGGFVNPAVIVGVETYGYNKIAQVTEFGAPFYLVPTKP
jgi:hypothetical protein